MLCKKTHNREGFTLIEIMIAIAIVGFMMAGAVIGYGALMKIGQKRAVESSLRTINTAIKTYKMSVGTYPKTLDDLVKKPADPKAAQKWPGSLIEGDEIPQDPWGGDFRYQVTPGGKHAYELYSEGNPEDADHTPINVWNI